MSVRTSSSHAARSNTAALLPAILAAYFAYLVADFITHAVVLARWWRATATYWLPPMTLLKRIPFAYASFGVYTAVLLWLMSRLCRAPTTTRTAIRLGAVMGLAFGTAVVLGNYSVFPMPASALLVWPASTGLASAVAAWGGAFVLMAERPWKALLRVFLLVVAVFVLAVIAQNLAGTNNVSSSTPAMSVCCVHLT